MEDTKVAFGAAVEKVQTIVHSGVEGRIIVMDSITFSDERNNTMDVLVGASFAGIISIRYPLRVDPKGVIAHDAGIGKDQAGVAGLWLLEGKGIPGAAVACHSARQGDGWSLWNDGVISTVNDGAAGIGVRHGMTTQEAAWTMLRATRRLPGVPTPWHVLETSERGRIMAMESVSHSKPENHDDVICAGSHGGVTSAAYSSLYRPRGVITSDGGLAKDNSGVAGLPMLQDLGIPGVAVSVQSARIGDGRSTYHDGLISAMNPAAEAIGVRLGMPARDAARLMLNARRPGEN